MAALKIGLSLGVTEAAINGCLSKFTPSQQHQINQAIVSTCLLPSKDIKLKPHQLSISKILLEGQRGIIVAYPMGAGKTITAIAAVECLKKQASYFGKKVNAYIIVPTSLINSYRVEMTKAGYEWSEDDVLITKTKFDMLIKKEKIPDLSRSIVVYDELHSLRTDYRCEFCGDMAKFFFKYSDRTVAENALKATRSAWRVIGLTGTPIYNRPYDWVNLWAFATGLEPLTLNEYLELHESLSNPKNPNRTDPKLALDKVFAFYELPSREDYPRREDDYHLIEMTENYQALYQNLVVKYKNGRGPKKKTKKDEEGGKNAFMVKLRTAMNKTKNKEGVIVKSPKVDVALSIIQKAKRGVIFFSEFLSGGVLMVRSKLEALGVKSAMITGEVSSKKRGDIVKQYNSKEVKVLFITKAGGEGLNLMETSDIIVFESGWTESLEEQVIARGIRYRSHHLLPIAERVVKVHHLLLILRGTEKDAGRVLKLTKKGKEKVWVPINEERVEREERAEEVKKVLPPKKARRWVIKKQEPVIELVEPEGEFASKLGADIYLKWYSKGKEEENKKELEFLKKYGVVSG